MAFPSTSATKVYLDQSTDSPAAARSELANLVDLVNEIISSYAQASGLCDLDDEGKVPTARLPSGLVDADTLDGHDSSYFAIASRTISAGGGLTGGGSLAANRTISHSDTSSQASVNNSNPNFIQDITVDTYGHVTAMSSGSVATSVAGLSVYSVGSYILAYEETETTTTNPGGTRSGSYLRPVSVGGALNYYAESASNNTYGTGMAGTWRCMGYSYGRETTVGEGGVPGVNGVTLWLRVS